MARRISGFAPLLTSTSVGHRVLVDEQMIDRPSRRRIGRFGNSLLSGNKNPAQRSVRPHLRSVEHFRMLGDEGLQFFLLREVFFFERFKLSLLIPGVDALCHCISA